MIPAGGLAEPLGRLVAPAHRAEQAGDVGVGHPVVLGAVALDVPAGVERRQERAVGNVQASGQVVDLPSAPAGASKPAFLGAAGTGDASSTVYTDGSTASGALEPGDWALGADAYPPRFGNEIVAKTPYRNSSEGGKQEINMYVFGATPITLDPGRQVKSITLNTPKSGSGSLQVFAWAFA
ncbi:hypothetical protein Airi01_100440 [Actinoallomurus iriomotensis]|uniref:Uncharacterized protein n=1 Tax=Actinoallomurus iriomotensis TaxID=478107 RepID=A0A9W6RX73_9ACTN|nr:hypothetical protein Airi01_100440 [Actinoallomurus iriomotensis]